MHSLSALKDQAADLIRRYVDPGSGYSFTTYDRASDEPLRELEPADILAANLLNLRLSAPDVIPLFSATPGPGPALLAAMNDALVGLAGLGCSFEDFESGDALDAGMEPLAAANRATRAVPGWTPVTVSKVLHRHLPRLVPIVDSRVRAFYDVRPGQEHLLRHRLWSDLQDHRGWLQDEAAKHDRPDGRPLTLLRAADIVIWMSWPDWNTNNGH